MSNPEYLNQFWASISNGDMVTIGLYIFNVLLVMGTAGVIAPSGGVVVSQQALFVDLPVMIAVSAICLPIFYTEYRITRVEGLFFLAFYAAYLTYLVLRATNHGFPNQLTFCRDARHDDVIGFRIVIAFAEAIVGGSFSAHHEAAMVDGDHDDTIVISAAADYALPEQFLSEKRSACPCHQEKQKGPCKGIF